MQTNRVVYENIPKDEKGNINYNIQWSHSSCRPLVKQVMTHCARDHSGIIPEACNTRVRDVSKFNIPSEVDIFKLCNVQDYFKNDREPFNIHKYTEDSKCINADKYEDHFEFDEIKGAASETWRNKY